MYNLLAFLEWDPDLFNRCYLDPELENQREGIMQNVLEKNWMLRPYIDNPNLFSASVQNWFKSHGQEFRKLWDTLNFDYNPIENYDRYESGKNKFNTERNQTGETTNKGTIKNTGTQTNDVDTTVTNEISAMNSSGFQNDTKSTTDGTETRTDNLTQANDIVNGVNLTNKGGDVGEYENHMHGNIGVTTTQEMIEQERRVVQFNLWDHIAYKFMNDNMIRVF